MRSLPLLPLLHLVSFISPSLLSLSLSHIFYYYYQILSLSLCVVSRLFQGHTYWVRSVAFGPGDLLASGSSDKTINLWDLETGKNVNTLTVCAPSFIHMHNAL